MTLDEAREGTGRGVAYRPPGGRPEYGEITSVNAQYAFVLYEGDARPKATRPQDIEFITTLKEL